MRSRTLTALALVAVATLGVVSCGDDDDDTTATAPAEVASTETDPAPTATSAEELEATTTSAAGGDETASPTGIFSGDDPLGPDDLATGEPVRIGYFNDGTTAGGDFGDDTIVARATVEFLNQHRGGIAGRPIELVECSTELDPAIATDCGNQFVEEGVVAVVTGASGFASQAFPPINAAGIPYLTAATGDAIILADGETAGIVTNALGAALAYTPTVAAREGLDSIVLLVNDNPSATGGLPLEEAAATALGIGFEVVTIPPGTPDMLPQISVALNADPGLVQIIGDPTFCLVALRGLYETGFDGIIVTNDACVDGQLFAPLPLDRLQELLVGATVTMNFEGDPDWELYQAIMDEYASSPPATDGLRGWTYQTIFSLALATQDLDPGDVSAETVAAALNTMPATPLALSAGSTFTCDGTVFPPAPASCTNAVLETRLDEDLVLSTYSAVDVSEAMSAIADFMTGG